MFPPLPSELILPLGRDVPGSGALLTLGFLILAAYTVGDKIVFGEGRFRPDTLPGLQLLVHAESRR